MDSYSLRHGIIRSCGCLRQEASAHRIRQNYNTKKFIGDPNGFKDKLGNPVQMVYVGKRNKSGVVGVSFDKNIQRWRARMVYKGEFKLNGVFENFTDAVTARKKLNKSILNIKNLVIERYSEIFFEGALLACKPIIIFYS